MRTRLFLLAAALIAFGASLGSGFHFDDYAIFSDPVLTSPSGWIGVWALRQTRPLTYFTYWLNYQVGGGDPLGYHLLNLALHLGVVLLLFECLRRLVPETTAALAAAIFAVHPIQAEAVDYVWGRAIVLATLLCLAALYEWIEGNEWAAVAWFAAALLAKEEVAAFPLALAVLPGAKGRVSERGLLEHGGAFGGGRSARDLGDFGDAGSAGGDLSVELSAGAGDRDFALSAAGGGAVRVHGGSRYTRRGGGVGAGRSDCVGGVEIFAVGAGWVDFADSQLDDFSGGGSGGGSKDVFRDGVFRGGSGADLCLRWAGREAYPTGDSRSS